MDFERFRLAASTADLADEPTARADANLLEFRMDLASDPLDALASYDGDLPLLVTNRVAWEGGEAPDTDDRLDSLASAIEYPAVVAVDLELGALGGADTPSKARPDSPADATRVLAHARGSDVSVVVSTHDFEGTPDEATIRERLARAASLGDVGKFAVTAETRGDVLTLLVATHEATAAGHDVATMAMGEVGRHSRAVAPLYGSRIGYAPVDPDAATAPGQFDLATLRSLVDSLSSG